MFNKSVENQYHGFKDGFWKVCGGRVLVSIHSLWSINLWKTSTMASRTGSGKFVGSSIGEYKTIVFNKSVENQYHGFKDGFWKGGRVLVSTYSFCLCVEYIKNIGLPSYIYNGNIFPSLNPAKIFQFISR